MSPSLTASEALRDRRDGARAALRRIACLALIAVIAVTSAVHAEELVAASFSPQTDALGMRWDVNSRGWLDNATGNNLHSSPRLQINGSDFNSQQPMMTKDGGEFVLRGQCGNVQVTRRVKIDAKHSYGRWVEIISNPGSAPAQLTAVVQFYLGNQVQSVVTDQGRPSPAQLEKKESGLLLLHQPHSSLPSLAIALQTPGAKVGATIQNNNNYQFMFNYTLTVPAGQSVAIAYVMTQRRLQARPADKERNALFRELRSSRVTRDLPAEVRRMLVNWRAGVDFAGGGWNLATALGVRPAATDLLAVGPQTRLKGRAQSGPVTVRTRFGERTVPFADVAAIGGHRFLGRPAQVYLRDGQVLVGEVTAADLRFEMVGGGHSTLAIEDLDRLVLASDAPVDADDPDAPLPSPEGAFVETAEGMRLLLSEAGGSIPLVTPWGVLPVTLADLYWAGPASDGRAGLHVALADGSRFFGFVGAAELSFDTALFGGQRIAVSQIRSLTGTAAPLEPEAGGDTAQPRVRVAGEQVLAATLADPELTLLLRGQQVTLPSGQIRLLRNLREPGDDAAVPGLVPVEVQTWDQSTLVGQLVAERLGLMVGEVRLEVPTAAVLELTSARPAMDDNTRARIAALVRQLGHAEWSAREQASTQLAELGAMARPMLEEAVRITPDPEVRTRAEALLGEME